MAGFCVALLLLLVATRFDVGHGEAEQLCGKMLTTYVARECRLAQCDQKAEDTAGTKVIKGKVCRSHRALVLRGLYRICGYLVLKCFRNRRRMLFPSMFADGSAATLLPSGRHLAAILSARKGP